MGVIILIVLVLVIGGVVGGLAYARYRKILREAKNYERGLKMVPLLIHLPPSSDDTEVGQRDVRDVTEETISKAQVVYNVIASTAQGKGFKAKLYGQRHIAFEIVAHKGLIHYYAAVPVSLVPVVQQAVLSAYPTARLEEVEEHNIFNPVGKITGTVGGEFNLKEDAANPIATYQETKRDGMQSILNAFSNLSTEDGAAVQILIRPASDNWTKGALKVASGRKDNKGKSSGFGAFTDYIKSVPRALASPPEVSEKDPNDKQLSNLEQSHVDSIEEKTRHPTYETLIRVVASSNTAAKSQVVLNNIVAAFQLFDAPGKNGFSYSEAKDIESFVTSFIFRFFPQTVDDIILNSVELATIFHLPDQRTTPSSGLERQASKQVDGPTKVMDEGTLMGYNIFRGIKKEIRLSTGDRRRHLYVVGQTGTGKTVMLENIALQDMLDGKGFAFIDPHGDAAQNLLSMVPKERTEDVIYFSPSDMDYPMGLNLFEYDDPDQKDFLIQEAINMLYKLYDPQRQGIIGPRYEHMFRNSALAIMADPKGGTFVDIPKLFVDQGFVKDKLKHIKDQTVIDFWTKEVPASQRSNDFGEVKSWFVSKFGAFLSNEMMRNIIGQTKSAYNLRDIMDNKKILLVNLSKGRTGELNSKLLGMIFVMKFQAAAMSRANIPEDQRVDFSLYVDEFQNFSTDSFATILSEARKYRLNLIVANQFISQLSEEVRDAVFGNVGSVISLRTGANDADFLVKQFSPVFDNEDLVKLPNYNAVVRLMIGGVPSQPFSMATVPPLGHPNPELAEALKKLSFAKYGRPKAEVEKDITERLKTREVPRPRSQFGRQPGGPGRPGQLPGPGQGLPPAAGGGGLGQAPGGLPPQGSPPQRRPAARPGANSFLDDFLSKRQAGQPPVPPQPGGPAPQPQQPPLPPHSPQPNPLQPPPVALPIQPAVQSAANSANKAQPAELVIEPATAPGSQKSSKPTVEDAKQINEAILKSEGADDIYIDKDGNLHYNQDKADADDANDKKATPPVTPAK